MRCSSVTAMKVSVICAADRPERLPCLYWSLVAQTHKDWELLILDQSYESVATFMFHERYMLDSRCQAYAVNNHRDWGQTEKEKAAVELARGDVLIFPADDSYYVPVALEKMVRHIEDGADIVVYGWLYDILGYQAMPPSIVQGHVDVGGFMMKRRTFLDVGWRDKSQVGDHTLLTDMLRNGASMTFEHAILYVKN